MKTTSIQSTSYHPATFADSMRTIDMKWIWIATFVIVVLVLKIFNPLETIGYLVENEGLGEAGASILGMAAGFTFPMTLGFTVIMFFLISGWELSWRPESKLVAAAAVLFVSGFVADLLGFGLLPEYSRMISGPVWLAFPLFVATGYLSSYGFELSVCAFAIGTAVAIQVERWYYSAMKVL